MIRSLFALAVSLLLCPVLLADTPLEKQMEKLNKSLRQLKPVIGDPAKKEAALGHLADAIAASKASIDMEPQKAKEIPEAERAKFIADYKKAMDGLVEKLGKIESAIREGQIGEARKQFEELGKLKRSGHDKFASEE